MGQSTWGVYYWNSNNKHEGLCVSLHPTCRCLQPGPCRRIWPSCWPGVPPVSVQAIPGRAQKHHSVKGFWGCSCSRTSLPCCPRLSCCPSLSCPSHPPCTSSPCCASLPCPHCPCRPSLPRPYCPCRPRLPRPYCPCRPSLPHPYCPCRPRLPHPYC